MAKLLEIKNLHTYFTTKRGLIKAANGVSLSLEEGKTLGIVGESGSGKSVTVMSILKLSRKTNKSTRDRFSLTVKKYPRFPNED